MSKLVWFNVCLAVLGVLACAAIASAQAVASPTSQGMRFVQPRDFHGRLRGEEGLIALPENRHNSASRLILVHYFRFPAREPQGLAPVFFLPGGPGESVVAEDIQRGVQQAAYSKYAEMAAFNQLRDVVIVNQRGCSGVPGIHALPAAWQTPPGKSSEPMSFADSGRRVAESFQRALQQCQEQGFDLQGYDMLHLVDDVDAIRRAYSYEKIALRGGSFGSQWALAYHQRYPEQVDRMILSGVEPIDYGYDSAQGIWNVVARIEAEARDSEVINLPEVGLLGAVQAVITRLEKQPVRVRGRHPTKGYAADVMIGADDFRHYLLRPIHDSAPHSRQMLEWWPKFVLEVYREDYQYLAAKIIDDRPEHTQQGLLLALVDNSLGISSDRQARLESEPARRWLGDINWFYTATRGICPTPKVSDSFRQPAESSVPMLMIHGTLDLATALENAEELLPFFPAGHLIKVRGGTHAATLQAANADPKFLTYLTAFMAADNPSQFVQTLPSEIRLPPLKFEPIGGRSLFSDLSTFPGNGADK